MCFVARKVICHPRPRGGTYRSRDNKGTDYFQKQESNLVELDENTVLIEQILRKKTFLLVSLYDYSNAFFFTDGSSFKNDLFFLYKTLRLPLCIMFLSDNTGEAGSKIRMAILLW